MTKKKIAIAIAAAALAGTCAIGGTLAWLTSTDTVTNTFTVGNVMLDVTETGETSGSNSYTIAPGDPFKKDPEVTLKGGSQDSYVFATIVNSTTGDSRITPEGIANDDAVGTKIANGAWELIYVNVAQNGTSTHVYRYTGNRLAEGKDYISAPSEDLALGDLFGTATLNSEFDVDGTSSSTAIEGDIVVKGYAIQAASFDTWQEAYAALQGAENSGLPALPSNY